MLAVVPSRNKMLNVDIPIPIFAKVRKNFLYNHERGYDQYEDCVIFAAHSVVNEALTFHIMVDNGAMFSRLPIHALCWKDAPQQPLSSLQSWDCFSEKIAAIAYSFLDHCRCKVLLPDKQEWGEYVCTFDWHGNMWSESPWQYKCLHLIKLDDGNFTLQPNNHLLWINQAFTDDKAIALTGEMPGYASDRFKYISER